nr:hypothetical protein [Tanacetum cinerariifolium]
QSRHSLQEKRVINSGCSRHMTGNMSYLSEYEEIDGGYVAFGRDPKGVLIYLAILSDTTAFEEFFLAILSVLNPGLIKTALGTKFLFGYGLDILGELWYTTGVQNFHIYSKLYLTS